ncbi:MAG: ligase-associated DNA damage response DEXH box helicase [Geminicoccaceae bacterium]|nr:MAG: ligase-associated DNA damage response DEXH box helicase [Geminicoccaceae bacterium]
MSDPSPLLPPAFAQWFAQRGWQLRRHQAEVLAAAEAGASALVIAPTGGGKTLAGFLPTLVRLHQRPREGLHTLYISPLKALATDIARNLEAPVGEMGLDVRIETRTGDTPQNRRQRQRQRPPHILLTTPESLALLLAYPDAAAFFAGLQRVVLDELHALVPNKRGQLLGLGIARLRRLAPGLQVVGLSATVAEPERLLAWLSTPEQPARLIQGDDGAEPSIEVLIAGGHMPWSGHFGVYAADDLYARIKRQRLTLIFTNTRSQAEIIFQALWRLNEDALPIGLHHGSLEIGQRRKVEAAMAAGRLKAVVCTSSLDLGIDWGDVDLVVQVGAPKGASRLLQRIGRANHRLDEPSKALLVPGNRFEVLECMAAIEAIAAHALDGEVQHERCLDVLAQHLVGTACAGPFDADDLYAEVSTAGGYQGLSRQDFDDVLAFVATGGYALATYERYRKLQQGPDGLWRLTDGRLARQWRMNVGVIQDAPMLKVRLGRRVVGEVEEMFAATLTPGDTFVFSGRVLTFEAIRETDMFCRLADSGAEPKVPNYGGTRLPLSTHLAARVRGWLAHPERWPQLPAPVREWLACQVDRSELPNDDELLVECFPRNGRWFVVVYAFAGWNAHQTLGMLLTRRLERRGAGPLGFVGTDHALAVWSLRPVDDVASLFSVDILGDDLEEWMAESSLLKRTFRQVATIAGLIERRQPGQEKTGRQMTVSSDLIYDVLRKHEPQHVLLRATRADAAVGLLDIRRLADLLVGVQGKIRVRHLARVSPLAVPVMVNIGRENVAGSALDDLLDEAVDDLVAEAMGPRLAA